MAENKTQPSELAVADFIAAIENDRRRREAEILLPLYEEWTGLSPVVWGNGLAGKSASGIIGFGRYHYKYASGREGEFFLTGFSPRKANMVCYIMPGFSKYSAQLKRLGRTGIRFLASISPTLQRLNLNRWKKLSGIHFLQ